MLLTECLAKQSVEPCENTDQKEKKLLRCLIKPENKWVEQRLQEVLKEDEIQGKKNETKQGIPVLGGKSENINNKLKVLVGYGNEILQYV